MSHEQQPLTVGEFSRWASRTDRTLGAIEKKQDDHGERLTRVETQLQERTGPAVLAPEDAKKVRNTSAGWSAGIAGVIIAALEILHRVGVLGK
jgi:hypothetical protein